VTHPNDADLLAHYVARGHESWNTSLAASWLDYELRAGVLARLPADRPLAVCNVGIGVGLFDDWLGHVLGAPITSVDDDPDICAVFDLRQRRERHPYPARVVCGDATHVLPAGSFDVVTCVGSTLREAVDRQALRAALLQALRPGGTLILADVRSEPDGSVSVEVESLGADGRARVAPTRRVLPV
jgi:SAM-dependent methyltransferase